MTNIDQLLDRACAGDRDALEDIVRAIQDDVYGLAIRMLWHPEDAEDASQTILMKVITNLGTFRRESSFRTWVCRIATNHLLSMHKSRAEGQELTFRRFSEDLERGLAERAPGSPDQALLEEEVKIGCTQAMLLCLDRNHRIAYILGEVFGVDSGEAAEILELAPAAFRKRLSRARQCIRQFMGKHCGLVKQAARCRCAKRIVPAIQMGRVDPTRLLFAGHTGGTPSLRRAVGEMETLHRTAAIFQSHPDPIGPNSLMDKIRAALGRGPSVLLDR